MSTFQDKLKGNWNQIKGMLKQEWADLTDDDLLYEEGREDELIGRIQKKTGETKEQINAFIEGLKFD
ncbi:CsbD family protein [Leadbetterella sp. DM7]|uniref:CsbD family protein n=1 Tax=Leadbetterella sp. DM7 TaxID=3235085 RepID=UPI00349EB4AC